MHVPFHLGGGGVLLHLAIDDRANALVVEVPVSNEPGADRSQGVGTLHAKHGTGVGIAEVMKAVVVADRVAGDVVARFVGRDVAAGLADHDDDLALVVQPLAAIRTNNRAVVRVERRDGLVEVRRCWRELRHELLRA